MSERVHGRTMTAHYQAFDLVLAGLTFVWLLTQALIERSAA